MQMTCESIERIDGFVTKDGKFHKTYGDASVHVVNCIMREMEIYCKEKSSCDEDLTAVKMLFGKLFGTPSRALEVKKILDKYV